MKSGYYTCTYHTSVSVGWLFVTEVVRHESDSLVPQKVPEGPVLAGRWLVTIMQMPWDLSNSDKPLCHVCLTVPCYLKYYCTVRMRRVAFFVT